MSPMIIAWVAFGCVFGGALLGISFHRRLPERHLTSETKDVVKLTIAVIATMSALVLSLLIASAKSSYDTHRSELTQLSADIVLLDRYLAHYGPEAKDARLLLRRSVIAMLDRMSAAGGEQSGLQPWDTNTKSLNDEIQELSPQNELQRSLQTQAMKSLSDLGHSRWLLFAESGGTVPIPFLLILIFWLTIIFASFGLFAPINATVIGTFLVCAVSVSGAIFLILELDRSFAGLLQISHAPLREALAHLAE